MGVVVRRYIDILIIIMNFPYSTYISSFFGSSIPNSLFIKSFSFLIKAKYGRCSRTLCVASYHAASHKKQTIYSI